MKTLYFWVTGVTLTTIPNMLSNLFQEVSGCYSTEAEVLWILAYKWLTCIHAAHPYFATSHVPRCTVKNHRLDSSFIYIGMTVLASVGLGWHNKRNLLFPVGSPSEVQWSSFLWEQPTAKPPWTLGLSGAINTYLWRNAEECSGFSALMLQAM